ncbi:MAG: tetratricopeptide repeat protein [Lachnospiraceae bacterium]|nr:tetratricopeptide repeat protein [Lachnospiraceae bacterium]
MGKIILCKGNYAKTPYVFQTTQTKVYSIEEVCYYIKNNIYLIKENYFSKDFAVWLDAELGLKNLSVKLSELLEKKADIKDLVVTVCCGCDYYTKEEIEELIKVMSQTENLDTFGRLKIRADNYFHCNDFQRASGDYRTLLKLMKNNTSNIDKTEIFNRLGLIYMKLGQYSKSERFYKKAYLANRDFKSLCGFMVAIELGENNDTKIAKLEELNVSPGEMRAFEDVWERIIDVAKESTLSTMVYGMINAYESGKQEEFNIRIDEVMEKIKNDYRILCN